MPYSRAHSVTRYAVAMLSVGLATALTLGFWRWLEQNRSLLFIAAVMVSALYGGLGPGLVASAASALASAFFLLEPAYSFDIGFDDFVRLLVFVAVGTIVSWLSDAVRRSEDALRRAHTVWKALSSWA